MSGWTMAGGLALTAFLVTAFVLKAPRRGWEAIGAALLLGIAGYALQAHPDQPGSPKAAQAAFADGSAIVEAQQVLAERAVGSGNPAMVVADAFTRRGRFGDAAGVLRGAVARNPNDGEAWLAEANALVSHAEGNLSPAALFAYRRATAAAPDHPGPPFFLGLALAQNGQLSEARAQWAALLARTPANAPWRSDLVQRLAALDAFIAEQNGTDPAQ
jgi:cytochrome c-type biogenesis protein CcmH